MEGKLGWVALPSLPSYVEYQVNNLSPLTIDQASDKRNRNPNWTDAEITRFLMILMEEPVLNDLNAQRNKQVFQKSNFIICHFSSTRFSAMSLVKWQGRDVRRRECQWDATILSFQSANYCNGY